MKHTLLLGSTSSSRQMLLTQAQIPFTLVLQSADEMACDWGLPLPKLVEGIALHKMESLVLPKPNKEGDICFVLTADTLSQDEHGSIHGKPTSREDAIEKLKQARGGMYTGTAFVLDRKIAQGGSWVVDKRIIKFVGAQYKFVVPDEWLERYLEYSVGLKASGAIAIEDYGSLFLQSIHGSYTAIVGLPLFELREALEQLGFF